MFDHVTIRVSDLEASRRFYELVFREVEFPDTPAEGGHFVEWYDFSISQASGERPVTRRLHVGFVAPSRAHVDRFWHTLTGAGYRDDGPPGPRPQYREDYYGAFVLDPDGEPAVQATLLARLADPVFEVRYTVVWALREVVREPAVQAALLPLITDPDLTMRGIAADDEPVTQNVHIAFPAKSREEVDAFHRAAMEAGYRDNGPPGERPVYHPGYYGAYVLDPDGNNVELVDHNRAA